MPVPDVYCQLSAPQLRSSAESMFNPFFESMFNHRAVSHEIRIPQ